MGIFSPFRMKQMAAPPTPAAGESLLYPKDDGRWYTKGTDGFEAPAIGRSEDTGWINIATANGWVAFDARVPQYRRVNGVVYFRGIVKDGASGTAAFFLPAGFRPEVIVPNELNIATAANGAFGYASIRASDGAVILAGSVVWHDLSSISFPVVQPTSFVIGDDTGWIAPTLSNGWSNYDVGGWEDVAYRRLNGIVYLKGLIKGGTTTDGTLLFNLPVGFRPNADSDKHISVASANALGVIKLKTNGDVTTATPMSASWVSLANISFPAENAPVAFVSAGDVTVKMETQGAVTHARNLVSGLTSSPSSLRYMRINTTMRVDAGLMPRFRIVGKTDAYGGAFDGHLTIYLYNTGGGTLYSPKWRVFGQAPSGVWVSKDASNQLVIIIDNTVGWSYAEVTVAEVANTYGTMTRPQTEGWTVSNTADTAGLSAIVQAT